MFKLQLIDPGYGEIAAKIWSVVTFVLVENRRRWGRKFANVTYESDVVCKFLLQHNLHHNNNKEQTNMVY